MIYVEAALLTILVVLCVVTSVTDIYHGLITNRHLLHALVPAVLLNVVYYYFFVRVLLFSFLMNLLVITLITLLFYIYNIWSAGDSKLLLTLILCIPARICYANQQGILAPSIQVIVLTFSIAYVYLVSESIIVGLKSKDLLQIRAGCDYIINFLKQYFICTIYVVLFNEILLAVPIENFYRNNTDLIMIINLLVIITVFHINLFSNKNVLFICLIIAFLRGYFKDFEILTALHVKIYVLAIFIILFRMIIEKYNYQIIPTDNVCAGMVLALSTIILFKPSRIKGLPEMTTEDIRSRLTLQEADNIKRWGNSKHGKNEIVIVRTMPFAIFISIGTIAFVITRVSFYGN